MKKTDIPKNQRHCKHCGKFHNTGKHCKLKLQQNKEAHQSLAIENGH